MYYYKLPRTHTLCTSVRLFLAIEVQIVNINRSCLYFYGGTDRAEKDSYLRQVRKFIF